MARQSLSPLLEPHAVPIIRNGIPIINFKAQEFCTHKNPHINEKLPQIHPKAKIKVISTLIWLLRLILINSSFVERFLLLWNGDSVFRPTAVITHIDDYIQGRISCWEVQAKWKYITLTRKRACEMSGSGTRSVRLWLRTASRPSSLSISLQHKVYAFRESKDNY